MFPSTFRTHWTDRVLRPRTRQVTLVATGAAAALAGATYLSTLPPNQSTTTRRTSVKVKLPRPLMEAAFGAVGEIAQVAVLYPLDTIKVRCQAAGTSAAAVLADLLRGGLNLALLRRLYAGVFSASVCSVVVGSVYYLSFCESKRLMARLAAPLTPTAALPSASATSLKSPPSSSSSSSSSSKHQSPSAAAASSTSSASATAAAGGTAALPGSTTTAAPDNLTINVLAAVSAALVGALIEAPVELFKNQTKAGLLQGNMLRHMAANLRTTGLRSWYWGFLPFCLKSLPYDIGELLTYSQLRDAYDRLKAAQPGAALEAADAAAAAPPTAAGAAAGAAAACSGSGSSSSAGGGVSLVAVVPEHVWDAGIGAAAGAAAVLVSMPADCIKTVMDTRGVVGPRPGTLAESAAAFVATGRGMVGAHGPAALFNGLLPRLGEKVPSTMLYWLAVEACRRVCEPYMSDEGAEGGGSEA